MLEELTVVQHTHPNPPFEKGGRNVSELCFPLEKVRWVKKNDGNLLQIPISLNT
jgi:hypothetical protein